MSTSHSKDGNPELAPSSPTQIGGYRILRVLGEGGMGTVYEAEQVSPRRTVALKLQKAGVATEVALRRFQLEAEVLGRLRHPGIAQVYEAGTVESATGELPYFAMEFIEGVTLDEFLEERNPHREARVELLAAICDAVQYAHQNGVIHRDLKPANILIDPAGRPKVVDFGIARLTDSESVATRATQTGQLLGTLTYMSPEQVSGSPDEVDTRSDVFALGLLLFFALSGESPYKLEGRNLSDVIRMVSRGEAPKLRNVSRDVAPDLDVITGKALERDKERRYASAAELAEDLRRFLRNEPISARAPTAGYQLRLLARRHRAAVLGALFTTLAILVGFFVSLALYAREFKTRTELDRSYSTTREVVEFLDGLLSLPADDQDSETVTFASALERGERWLEAGEVERSPESLGWIHGILGNAFLILGENEAAERNLLLSLDTHASKGSARIRALLDVATARARRGATDDAEAACDEALALARAEPGPEQRDLVKALAIRASVMRSCARYEGARDSAKQLLELTDELDADRAQTGLHRSRALRILGEVEITAGKSEDARVFLARSLEELEAAGHTDDIEYAEVLGTLAGALSYVGDPAGIEMSERSIELTERIRGRLHPDTAVAWANHASILQQATGDLEAALIPLEKAIAIERGLSVEPRPSLGNKLTNLGVLMMQLGKMAEARVALEEAVAVQEATLGPDHPDLATALMVSGRVALAGGELDKALDLHWRAYEINLEALGQDHYNTIMQAALLAAAEEQAGHLDEALELRRVIFESASLEGSAVMDMRDQFRRSLRDLLLRKGDPDSLSEAAGL